MKSILDPSFRYTSSVNTDIRRTFARIRREQRQQGARLQQRREGVGVVVSIATKGKEK